jgi:hypothetical protein
MTADQPPPLRRKGPKLTSAEAQARLADALRENLKRRKSQQRVRDQKEGGNDGDEGSDKSR